MIKGASLTSPYTQLDILSLPPIALIFPLQSWSHHGKLSLYCWSHYVGILSTHRNCITGATNHTKISDFASLSWSHHGKLSLYCWSHYVGILSTHRSCTAGATNHTKISDFASLSLNLHRWVYDYFTFKYLLLYSNYYYNY